METTREEYKARAVAKLHLWGARLDSVKAKADVVTAEARVGLLEQAEQLRAFETSARHQLAEVEASAADAWHEVKGHAEQSWEAVSGSVEELWARMSGETH